MIKVCRVALSGRGMKAVIYEVTQLDGRVSRDAVIVHDGYSATHDCGSVGI